MIPTDWLTYARIHRDALNSLIRAYHPQLRRVNQPDLEISAPQVESAARVVREHIARETTGMLWPTVRFDAALANGDHAEAAMILSETWCGVPESTSCWMLTGFKECVDLLDDPVEQDGA